MCRHLAYVGEPRPLSDYVLDSDHSLQRQSYQPRLQKHGLINVDGFGAGWYLEGREEPVRYRQSRPIWADPSFASLAPTIAPRVLLAAVRSASEGCALEESAVAPFQHERWLFSHNGRLSDWPRARKALWERVLDVPEALANVDSALVFGLAVEAWSSGASLGDGLAHVVETLASVGDGRLNLLASDGTSVAATRYGDDLFVLEGDNGIIVASEPLDDDPAWHEVPDLHLVVADHTSVSVRPLPR